MAAGDAAPVSLRAARAADAPALARLFAASRRAATPWLPVLWTAEQELAWMSDTVLPARGGTVAEAGGGEVVGFVARRGGWIGHLYLAPGRRRRGVGSALLEVAVAGGGAPAPALRLHAFARNAAACAFYGRRGFRAVAESDGSDNEEREPSVVYERRRPQGSESKGGTTR
jgi:ribosomal protein S18 acetylase RimI-like enzyme